MDRSFQSQAGDDARFGNLVDDKNADSGESVGSESGSGEGVEQEARDDLSATGHPPVAPQRSSSSREENDASVRTCRESEAGRSLNSRGSRENGVDPALAEQPVLRSS
jgi:hypothetical protein